MESIFISFTLSVCFILYILKKSDVIKISKKTIVFYIIWAFLILIFSPYLHHFSMWLWIKMGVFELKY